MSAPELPADADGWLAFFSGFPQVVLVANSDQTDLGGLSAAFGERTLFVFFNKTYKILEGRFERPSLLVARSSEAGANIVYRREVAEVVRPLAGPSFHGVLNLKCASPERFSPASAFAGETAGFLDLSDSFDGLYPSGLVPSSGFALAVWLVENVRPDCRVHLAGFSARRSTRWKLFAVHDWTFEQTLLRLLVRKGHLSSIDGVADRSAYERISERFPDLSQDAVNSALGEVLSERLASTDRAVDRLFSLTRWQTRLDDALRAIKPRTRKQRLKDP